MAVIENRAFHSQAFKTRAFQTRMSMKIPKEKRRELKKRHTVEISGTNTFPFKITYT
jgi:hypothetical protein